MMADKDIARKEFIRSFPLKVFSVCKELGWWLDDVLDMNIEQFNQVFDSMQEIAKEQEKESERNRLKSSKTLTLG